MTRILLIDDDTPFRTMLCIALKQMGYDVTEAVDGEQGFDLYKAGGRFDVVVTDLLMPRKEGIETIMALRKLDPAVKVIAMSGGGRVTSVNYLAIARQVGAKKMLEKPFLSEDIRSAINEVLTPSSP